MSTLRELKRFKQLKERFVAEGNSEAEAEKLATISLEVMGEEEVGRLRLAESFEDKFIGQGIDLATAKRMGMVASEGRRPGGLGWEGMGDEGYGPAPKPEPEPMSDLETSFYERFELQFGPVVARRMAKIAAGTGT